MLHRDIWLLWTFLQPLSFPIFFNQYCSNLLKNSTVRGLSSMIIKVLSHNGQVYNAQ